MSVLGIDIGTSGAVMATIQRGAIAVVRNAVSERITPTLVAYTQNERLMGDHALATLKSNSGNTCRNFKSLLGASSEEPRLAEEAKYALAPLGVDGYGFVGYNCQNGSTANATQVTAAFLTSLKGIAETSLSQRVTDCVIAVPSWYEDANRRAMEVAAQLAGIKCLRVMNEHAAIALDYGIFRAKTFSDTEPTVTAFVSVGHGQTVVFVAEFLASKLKVLSVTSNPRLGGRAMDSRIVQYMVDGFKQTTKLDPSGNAKAMLKLEECATKIKKLLSANSEVPYGVDYLYEDEDLQGVMSRDTFEALCQELKIELEQQIRHTVEQAGVAPSSVEVMGGCTRIPWVFRTIGETFGFEPMRTLSSDETVARGCALQAAMLSPNYKVRDFGVGDVCQTDILAAFGADDGNSEQHVLFKRGDLLFTPKAVTCYRKGPFQIQLAYSESRLPGGMRKDIGTWTVNLAPHESNQKLKVYLKLSANDTVDVTSVSHIVDRVEEVEEKELIPEPTSPEAEPTEEVSAAEATPKEPQYRIVKKAVTKTDRRAVPFTCYLGPAVATPEQIDVFTKTELALRSADELAVKTRGMLNCLEETILGMRFDIHDRLKQFFADNERAVIDQAVNKTEEWVWDNMDAPLAELETKLEELRTVADCGYSRHRAELERIRQEEEERRLAEEKRHQEEQEALKLAEQEARQAAEEALRKAQEEMKAKEETEAESEKKAKQEEGSENTAATNE
ncbi:MAG: hypothetical protein KVP17_001640 [Porospora cf. gigantea B]|uniref:uncharacterized protein n=1 Tax=Porospora cf. gigantea B TaxID=2853592 RepID=UPI003571A232|nr:MAG: hypothetical protein KVP17_001640 [Porospora cf. gigantea B]